MILAYIIIAVLAVACGFSAATAWSQRRTNEKLKRLLEQEEGAHRIACETQSRAEVRLLERNEAYSDLHVRYVQLDNELARVRLENGCLERRQIDHINQIDFLKRTKKDEMERTRRCLVLLEESRSRVESLLATNAELAEKLADAMTKKRKRS